MNQDQEKPKPKQPLAVLRNLKWGSICAGAFVGLALAFVFTIFIGGILDTTENELSGLAIIFIIILFIAISYTIGGAIAGSMAKSKGWIHGLISGLFAWIITIFLYIPMGLKHIDIYWMFALVLVLGCGALGGLLGQRMRQNMRISRIFRKIFIQDSNRQGKDEIKTDSEVKQ